MNSTVTERRLVDVLVSHLRKDHQVTRGLRHYEKTIDVVALRDGSSELCAIEAKTANWQRAIQQAILNLTAAEHCYIALSRRNVHRVSHDLLDKHGIGLISVGSRWGDVEFLKKARHSPYLNHLANGRIKRGIKARGLP